MYGGAGEGTQKYKAIPFRVVFQGSRFAIGDQAI
jgi:hypothetical protein